MNMTSMTMLAAAALAAFLFAALAGRRVIPLLHRLKFGQTIRDVGPSWHKSKQGTPTMGGLLFIGSTAVVFALGLAAAALLDLPVLTSSRLTVTRLLGGVLMALCCGALGFADDYIKVVKKRNLGLTAPQKLFGQLVVALGYGLTLYLTESGSRVNVPFLGPVDFGLWVVPFALFVVVAMTNAVNLTDGIDGLCGSVTFIASLFFLIAAGYTGYLGQGLLAAVLAGSLAGFLVWNLHPARVFMGDTGSLFLGGMLTALAFGINQPFLLLPVGIVYITEVLSVMLQVLYFKATGGKRLFKMAPLHHHCEMSGWSEAKIVTVFSLITLAGCAAAWGLLTL